MSFKKMNTNLSFADIALINSFNRNRAIERIQQINAVVDGSCIDRIRYNATLYPFNQMAISNMGH